MILPTLKLDIERWKFNKEYNIYVSNKGHFKDANKQVLPVKINGSGYCCIKTSRGYRLAHRLVMCTWAPLLDAENLTIDHLDHNKRNNSLENLEWVTEQENLKRSKRDKINACKAEAAGVVYATKDSKDKPTVLVNDTIRLTEKELIKFCKDMGNASGMKAKEIEAGIHSVFANHKKHYLGLSFKF